MNHPYEKRFPEIAGYGGYGLVAKNSVDNIAIKFINSPSDCKSAKNESDIQRKVYNAVKTYTSTHSLPISVSKPIAFLEESLKYRNTEYSCAYIMKLIDKVPGYNLIHIIGKLDYAAYMNMEKLKNPDEPPSEKNPSRGFFATTDFIEEKILPNIPKNISTIKLQDIYYCMGVLYGCCLFGAEYMPIDGEYVLSVKDKKLVVTLLDFGMFEKINFTNANWDDIDKKRESIEEIEFYFPYDDDPNHKYFLEGVYNSGLFFVLQEIDEIKKSSKNILLEKYK